MRAQKNPKERSKEGHESLRELEEPKEILDEHLRRVGCSLRPLLGSLGALLMSQMKLQGDLEAVIGRKNHEKHWFL